jgi:hypothetical protein
MARAESFVGTVLSKTLARGNPAEKPSELSLNESKNQSAELQLFHMRFLLQILLAINSLN